jgi:hypothetical protein
MSTYKRISGDYTIQSVNTNDKIYINSGNVFIEGNLWVSGNTQTVSSTNSAITNAKIVLNSGASVANPAGGILEVDRGSTGANVQLRWSETLKNWQVTTDGSTYSNIVTSSGSMLSNVYADSAPAISANLDLRGHAIWDSTTNATALTLSTPAGAGSGVYATPTGGATVELVTQSKALAYSIIFG